MYISLAILLNLLLYFTCIYCPVNFCNTLINSNRSYSLTCFSQISTMLVFFSFTSKPTMVLTTFPYSGRPSEEGNYNKPTLVIDFQTKGQESEPLDPAHFLQTTREKLNFSFFPACNNVFLATMFSIEKVPATLKKKNTRNCPLICS